MWGFAATIFLSAFLLFQIQPLIGKYILPWFGGTPAVWSTCMLFFQILLLGGYAYAHAVASRLTPKRQGQVHAVMVVAALLLIAVTSFFWTSPITPGEAFKPTDSSLPILRILLVLGLGVGLPYFLLSTTGPLVQAWFARVYPHKSPYRLYVLSNVGSLLALLSYPFVFEPMLPLTTQANAWSVGFVVYGVMVLVLAWVLARRAANTALEAGPGATSVSDGGDSTAEGPGAASMSRQATSAQGDLETRTGLLEHEAVWHKQQEEGPPTFGRKVLWMSLAAVASLMLLATTNQMCQEVAVIPFLWILPLVLYLLSFILVFSKDAYSARVFWMPAMVLSSAATLWAMFEGVDLGIVAQVAIYSVNLFVVCMVAHGEMVRLRPKPEYLTSFYLMMSLGGAMGGLFVSAVAPFVFLGFWELHVGIALTWALVLVQLYRVRRQAYASVGLRAARLACGATTGVVLAFLVAHIVAELGGTVYLSRNFYGLLKVKQEVSSHSSRQLNRLTHGAITHGMQYTDPALGCVPTSYYGPTTGAGLAINFHPRRVHLDLSGESVEAVGDRTLDIGAIGMGTGTLASLGEPGDRMRFYEINPQVISLSKGKEAVFTYADKCPAIVDVAEGDARITLEREVNEGRAGLYDVLLVDAFSSDSIPVHLLTVEAVQLYQRAMKPDGILVVHISNRHLDLRPVVFGIARHLGLFAVTVDYDVDSSRDLYGATWIILTNNKAFFETYPVSDLLKQQEPPIREVPLWTDNYSNLSLILK